jgi:hypothetical protein
MNNVPIMTLLLANNQSIITMDKKSLKREIYRSSRISVNFKLKYLHGIKFLASQ